MIILISILYFVVLFCAFISFSYFGWKKGLEDGYGDGYNACLEGLKDGTIYKDEQGNYVEKL